MGKWMHPDIQIKKRIHRNSSLIFFQPSLELIKAVGRSLLLDFSFMADHAFPLPVWSWKRETTTLNERPKIMWGAFLQNFRPVFSFLPARSLDMTCPLTSDWQFSSPHFGPCCLNKGVLTETSVTGYQRPDLQCWQCVFRTHREAQSGTVGPFHAKSWVLWTVWHSRCVCVNVQKLSQN